MFLIKLYSVCKQADVTKSTKESVFFAFELLQCMNARVSSIGIGVSLLIFECENRLCYSVDLTDQF